MKATTTEQLKSLARTYTIFFVVLAFAHGCGNDFACRVSLQSSSSARSETNTKSNVKHEVVSTPETVLKKPVAPVKQNESETFQNSPLGNNKSTWILGYYVGYQSNLYPPETINYDALTHLAVGTIFPNDNGSLDTELNQGSEENGSRLAEILVDRAHNKGVKVLAMLGGAGMRVKLVAATTPSNLNSFVASLVAYARDQHGMDGLDLAWEPIKAEDEKQFEAFVDALRQAWPEIILTFPTGYIYSNRDKANPFIARIASKLDQINIQSYSMAVALPGSEWESWHSSALRGQSSFTPTSISESVKMYLGIGVPPSKLGVGIGFFGICYSTPVTGPRQKLNGSRIIASGNSMSYSKIMQEYYPYAKYSYDQFSDVPYLTLDPPVNDCSYISYEDEKSIIRKAEYVKKEGLGGAIIWTVNQGYLPDAPSEKRDPLMTVIQENFQ
ncbi:MAG: glycoside hydrolase family 18 protein [Deltaproteobacteria bacterium]|nr:glycoside hydrolase family 18 protein [Deltaproteobacteria bacterium]